MSAEPIRTTTYILSPADALAYEQATARLTVVSTLALIVWLAVCGAAAWLIPLDWAGPRLSWSFSLLALVLIAIGYVLALLMMARAQMRRARKRVRRRVEMQLVEWSDRLEFSGSGLPRTVPLREIKSGQLTRTHLFFETAGEPIILPRRAFPEEGSIEALDARIAEASRPTPPSPLPASLPAEKPPEPVEKPAAVDPSPPNP